MRASLIVLTACLTLGGGNWGAHAEPDLPKQREHPYLFFSRGELEGIRKRFEQPPQSYYLESLIDSADDSPESGSIQLWAYLLTGERKYRDKCMKWVKSEWDRADLNLSSVENQWLGGKVGAMAQVYDTLYNELSEEERSRIKAYLERGLEGHIEKMNSWFYNNPSNTVPAQAGPPGLAALALMWESPKAAEAVVATRGKLLRYARRCFPDDGGYIEGTLYWSFGVSNYLGFAHADHNTTGKDDLLTAKNLLKQHRFAETVLGGDGQFMPFNDSQPWLNAWGVCADLGRRGDNALLLWLADHMAAMAAGEREVENARVNLPHSYAPWPWVMMTQGEAGPDRKADRPFPGVPTLSVLEKMHWGVMRSSGEYIAELVVGVKGSRGPLSHHGQKDLGSFVLYAGGEMLLLDPGYYNGEANCHSLPLINGKGPGRTGSSIVQAWQSKDWRAMVVDSTASYRVWADRVRRTLVMHGDRAVVLLDDIVPGPGTVEEEVFSRWAPPPDEAGRARRDRRITAQYQAAHKAEVDDRTGVATVAADDGVLRIWTFGPELTLGVTERDFGRSWLFARRAREGAYAWHSLQGDYFAETDNPLVTVLIPAAKASRPDPPTYERDGKKITVKLPDGAMIDFEQVDGVWKLTRPQRPAGDDRARRGK